MKIFSVLVLIGLVSGCVSDVSNDHPHSKLVDTVWTFKTDAYIVEYKDNRGVFLVVPCVSKESGYLPDRKWKYDEGNIGAKNNTRAIIAGLRKNEKFRIKRVMKRSHIEAGTSYYPVLSLLSYNKQINDRELNGSLLYDGFDDKGILNPEYAEKVSMATNPPPRGAEGGGGSESSNP